MTTHAQGAPYNLNQSNPLLVDESATLDNADDLALVSVTSLTVTLPPNPRVGQKHTIGGVGFAVTVAANSLHTHTIPASGGNTVAANTTRTYTFTGGTTWLVSEDST